MNIYKTLNSADANLDSEHDWSVALTTRFGTMSLSKNLISGLAPEGSKATAYMEALDYSEQVCVYAWRAVHDLPTPLDYKRTDAIAADIKLAKVILSLYCDRNTVAKRTARLTTLIGAILPLVRNFEQLRKLRKTNKAISMMVLPYVTSIADKHVISLLEQDVYPHTRWHDPRLVEVLKHHIDFSEGVDIASCVGSYNGLLNKFTNTVKLVGEGNFIKMAAEAIADSQDTTEIYPFIKCEDLNPEVADALFLKWADRMIVEITTNGIADIPYSTLDTLEYAMDSDFKRESNVPAIWNLTYLLGVYCPEEPELRETIEKIRLACIEFLGDDELVNKITNECIRQGYVTPKATIWVKESDKDDFELPPAEVIDPTAVHPTPAELALPSTHDDGMNSVRDCAVATNWATTEYTAPAVTIKWELPLAIGKTPEMIDVECSMMELHALYYRICNHYRQTHTALMSVNLPDIAMALVSVYAATRNSDVLTIWQGDNGRFDEVIQDSECASRLQELDELLERFRCDVEVLVNVHGEEFPTIKVVIGSMRLTESANSHLWVNV